MALDGLLPHQLAKKHPRFDTPYVAILALGGSAFLVSLVGGLAALISSAVLLLSFVYLLTCVAGLVLLRRNPQVRSRVKGAVAVPVTGAAICIVLMMLVQPITWAIGLTLMAVGIPVYMFFSPRKELKDLRERFYSREYQTAIRMRQSRRFLALLVHLAHHLYQRARRW
jgi:APA family basic amino acid/polyamine antiporter